MDELARTVELGSPSTFGKTDVSQTFAPVAKYESNLPSVTGQLNEATRQLLRSRLIIAAATTLSFLLAIKALSLVVDGYSHREFLTRLTAVLVLVGALIVLIKWPGISLLRLRIMEIGVFAIPVAEALLVLVQEVQNCVDAGTVEQIPTLFALISFGVALFIAIYGMYIPSDWRRTLLVTTIAAVAPTVVAWVHSSMVEIEINDYPGFAAPLMTLTMAAVATKAAHVVQLVRREAAEAKQYGQYQLVKKIGEGGMGIVYKAKHRMLKRPAAIKLVRTEFSDNPQTLDEFEHEVQLSASLTHWNTVQVYDYGRTDDGEFFYVMEYLAGLTLEQRIHRGQLTGKETVEIVSQICDGLAEAHGKEMVHRDLKPANIMLIKVGRQYDVVKILDFGLAAMRSEVSRLKKVSGTPAYISPEQIRRETIDQRSDIYSLGLVIYECLVGQRLMVGDSVGELLNHHLNTVPSLEGLPESKIQFADVIHRCVEKDPAKRFSDVTELKLALQKLV